MEIDNPIIFHVYLPKIFKETKLEYMIGMEVLGIEYVFSFPQGIRKKEKPAENIDNDWEWSFKTDGGSTKKDREQIDKIAEQIQKEFKEKSEKAEKEKGEKEKEKKEEEEDVPLQLEYFSQFYSSVSGREIDVEKIFTLLLRSEKFGELYNQFEEKLKTTTVNTNKYNEIKFETTKVSCLNEKNDRRAKFLFDGKNDTYLESDCDEQLLLFIPLNQKTRVKSLGILSTNDEFAPKTLRIYKNKKDMDFDSVDDLKATQIITLQKKQDEQIIDLDFVLFQDVNCLTLFFENNYGSESTKILKLRLIGENLLTVKNLDSLVDQK